MTRSLSDLVDLWERVASRAATYSLTLDDWLNDLDVRDIIARQLATASEFQRAEVASGLAKADDEFRAGTREAVRSLWGETAGRDHDRELHWWFFRYPSSPGGEIRSDLIAAGVLARDTNR
jgi:hypothetical protein